MNRLPENADVWLLAGQSNMAGSGLRDPYETPSDRVWLFSLRDEWRIAEEPFSADRFDAVDLMPGTAIPSSISRGLRRGPPPPGRSTEFLRKTLAQINSDALNHVFE